MKLGNLIPPFFILKIALAIQGLLCFHDNFKIFFVIILWIMAKNAIGSLIWIATSSLVTLTTLTLPIQEHVASFHHLWFLSSFIRIFLNKTNTFCFIANLCQWKMWLPVQLSSALVCAKQFYQPFLFHISTNANTMKNANNVLLGK